MLHHLPALRENLHANFVPGAPAALTIRSGDEVVLEAPDVSWGLEPPTTVDAPRRKFEPRDPAGHPARDRGPCLIGPVAIQGAQPGDTLRIDIRAVRVSDWGWTYAGRGMANPAWNSAVGIADAPLTLLRWRITDDGHGSVALSDAGDRVTAHPFPGTIGLAPAPAAGPGPAEPFASGWVPRACGGNMDCPLLIAGSTLDLPVMVPGGMLSAGDAHAAQGGGEVAGTAIECALRELRLGVTLLPFAQTGRAAPSAPRILTAPDAAGRRRWATLGFGPTLDAAAAMATSAMLDLMAEHLRRPRAELLALASSTVSLHVTQVVNPHVGVHAMWSGPTGVDQPPSRA